jgi:hypothetical protein
MAPRCLPLAPQFSVRELSLCLKKASAAALITASASTLPSASPFSKSPSVRAIWLLVHATGDGGQQRCDLLPSNEANHVGREASH